MEQLRRYESPSTRLHLNSEAGQKMVEKMGSEVGQKMGKEIGQKMGSEIGQKMGSEVGQKMGKEIGKKMNVSTAIPQGMGVAFGQNKSSLFRPKRIFLFAIGVAAGVGISYLLVSQRGRKATSKVLAMGMKLKNEANGLLESAKEELDDKIAETKQKKKEQ